MPLVQSIFNKTMLDMGQEVSNNRELLQAIFQKSLPNVGSVHSYSLLSSRPLQCGCHQATPDLRRNYEVGRKEP